MSRFLAIDADPGAVHVAAGTARGGTARLDRAVSVPLGEPLSPATAADLGRRLRDALKEAGIPPAPAVAVVGRDRVILKDVKIPKVPAAEEPAVVRFQASKDMTEAPDTVVLDYYPLERPEPDGQVRAVTASVRKDALAAYRAFFQAAGLRLAGVTSRPQGVLAALDRAVATGAVTAPEGKRASVAILTRGERWGELVIARDGQVVFSRSITGTALNSEPMFLGELRRNLAVYNGQTPQQPVEALYVAEAAGPGGWSGRVRAGLAVSVQAFDPLAGVENDTPADARGHFAALAGVLQLKAAGGRLPIDFAAPRQPASPQAANRRALAMAASLLALLVIGGLGFGYVRVQQKQARLTSLVREKVELEKALKDLEEDKKRVDALREWDDTRVNWLDQAYDLAAMFPDVGATRLEQFRAEPLAIPKGAKGKQNVARVFLKVQTQDAKYMDALQGALLADKKYHNVKKDTKPGSGTRGGFPEAYELRADIEKRPANEYIRKLTATPYKPARAKEDAGDGSGFPNFGGFGGGFGGAGQ